MKEQKIYTWRPDRQSVWLDIEIKELDINNPDMSRNAIVERAIDAVADDTNWKDIQSLLPSIKGVNDLDVPISMQARITSPRDEKLREIIPKIMKDLDIKRVKTVYLMKLLLLNYRECLKKDIVHVGNKKTLEEMSGPDMVRTLVEMILLNRKTDLDAIESIKKILLDWRNDHD